MSAPAPRRIYWIDGLKTVVVIGIALFHSALVFSPGQWIVNNVQRSLILGGFAGFTFQWGIALLFLLAGSATWFGLRSRGSLRFAQTRVVRLGIPLVVGLAVFTPLQSYVQHNESLRLDGLLRSYLTVWTSVHPSLRPSSAYDLAYHMWFLTHLLAISLLTLPVAAWLRSSTGQKLIARLVPWIVAPGGFLLGAVPVAAVQVALHPRFPLYQDWSDVAVWAVLYLEGFVIMADARFEAAIRERFGPALLMSLLILAVSGLASATGAAGHPDYSVGYLGYQALSALNTWCWVVVLLAIGMRWLDTDSLLTRWGADRPLPFYVLSHPIIVVVALYVVSWNLGLWAKFAVTAGFSIGVTLGLCEIVARVRVLRLLFGLSAEPKRRRVPADYADDASHAALT
ncbi:MAG: acyltransferase family protein [Isosphaeraceae bacterium]